MISTRFYTLDTHDLSWEEAHLFEHVLLNAWDEHIPTLGYHNGLYGWVGGKTFENYVFIDAGFYDEHVAVLFDNFIKSSPTFTDTQIRYSLAEIGAEDKALFEILHFDELKQKLSRASAALATGSSLAVKDIPMPSISSQRNAAAYRDISLVVIGHDLTGEEQVVLQRLKAMIIDYIIVTMNKKYCNYPRGHSALRDNKQDIGYFTKITLAKGQGSLKHLSEYVESELHMFPVKQHWEQIATHFEVFAHEALWKTNPIDYYRNTGIVTTVEEIARLATPKTVASIIAKLTVEARPHNKVSDQFTE